jgi:putative membrane protein
VTIVVNLVRGVAVGVANIIPGVSGGTIAVILRMYERLITAIRDLMSLRPGWPRSALFLGQIALGAAVGLVALARVIEYLLETHTVPTHLFFMGLILGSVPALLQQSRGLRAEIGQLLAAGSALALVVLLSVLGDAGPTAVYTERSLGTAGLLVASGIAGAAAMVVPGISGSFLLLLIGTYATIIHGINELDLFILGATALGAVLGLAAITRVIAWLFERAPGTTYAAILGLVAGSLLRLWPGVPAGAEWFWAVAAFIVGAGIAAVLGAQGGRGGRGVATGG